MNDKKILIVGNNIKDIALAKYLSKTHTIFITSFNKSTIDFATCIDIREDNIPELLEFVLENGIDMTIVTSKDAILSGITQKFVNNGQNIFAPSLEASQITLDKCFAKKILYKLKIPTPKFGIFEKSNMAIDYIKNNKIPFVIKNNDDNSAAIFTSTVTAKNIIETAPIEKDKKIIIEDYIYGVPFSFYAITDGYKALPFGSSLTYKHALEGDGGQLTSGLGACSPNYHVTLEQEYFIMDNVIYPVLENLEKEGNPYTGILGVNGILSDDKTIQILGFNLFMQDCDISAILECIDEDLYSLFNSCIIGSFSDEVEHIKINDSYSSTIVLTNKNRINQENPITGFDFLNEDSIINFYPNVTKNKYLEYEAKFGPVMQITTTGSTLRSSIDKLYKEIDEITFQGKTYRKDIGKPCSLQNLMF